MHILSFILIHILCMYWLGGIFNENNQNWITLTNTLTNTCKNLQDIKCIFLLTYVNLKYCLNFRKLILNVNEEVYILKFGNSKKEKIYSSERQIFLKIKENMFKKYTVLNKAKKKNKKAEPYLFIYLFFLLSQILIKLQCLRNT